MLKKIGLPVLTAFALATFCLPVRAQQFIDVLTGGTSGVYYPLGVALANIYAKAIPNAKSSAQATKASVENLSLLQVGRGELAFTLGDALSQGWKGDTDVGFTQKLDKLRDVAAIYPNYIQIVATKASGIKTLADLKGKRMSVGAAKSGTELNARAVLKAAGLSYDDLAKVEYLDFGASVDLMKNRQLDATLISAGLGVSAIRDLATAVDIVMIPVPPDVVTKIGDPAYQPTVIPAKTYEGQDADVPAIAIQNFLVTRSDLDDNIVYAMTKAIFDNLGTLVAAHSAAKDIKLADAAKPGPVPFAAGAERFYKEKGVLK
ncbi:MAG TPA: TAXI family TRAP transporter solute-binding subunit [Stellaceae bacterium]|nr:TAXI family TRAP transporter solute-binding subunit [Stellaceae bacterium]